MEKNFSKIKTVENIIIKTSYTNIANGELKSNFGDLLRTSLLPNCLNSDFLWLTDARSIDLLKYFVDVQKIRVLDRVVPMEDVLSARHVYNLDNYFYNGNLLEHITGHWHGYVWNGERLIPENEMIAAAASYAQISDQRSMQELIVRGLGLEWDEQDYPQSRLLVKETIDIGFNWHVDPKWIAKTWPEAYWEELEKILHQRYTVSWQKGIHHFDEYIHWLSACKVIVTCETLGLHLASALRKKVIAIVGPMKTNEYTYGRIEMIKPSSRDCMPCESPECKMGNSCLGEITPERVSEAIKKLMPN
ncbi:MAG: glycosyl transferase family 9 [Deltaproteobacteria bacterium]|nr:glycosyl transferase family 9 [Deltaproteobacteria bacterium]